ncbi:MAG: AAA family ATPase [Candidatus Riflebacteria bacterium]|nr:AAA family ATPase [Candidatus Riflebacteria bacterium]
MNSNDPITRALALPGGARFYRCALQVNPYAYLQRHGRTTPFVSEEAYNEAMVQACLELGIEVIAVTDHFGVGTAEGLRQTARSRGLHVFPGFEAVTKEGVHMLCLFPMDRETAALERVLGDCGILDDTLASGPGKYDVLELLEAARQWSALCVAAHVAAKDGLLGKLSGQPRVNAWCSPLLLACSLPGPASEAPQGHRDILENRDPAYRRDRPIAIVNAQDVQSPEGLAKPGSSCWLKMSQVSLDGLRQAFLDPESRVRLSSDPAPQPHAELVALSWQSGFLDGEAIHFNENLNVLIGGRGTGKSTVVESLRYVLGLEPLGDEARKAHEGIVRHVLGSGTKLSLLLRSHRPKKHEYRIERTIPNPVVVRDDETGDVVSLSPADLMPRIEVYGQHEISELTKSPEKLTRLLGRFARRDPQLARRKEELVRELQRSRSRVSELQRDVKAIDERLAALPSIETTLRAYQEAGLEERLKDRSLLVREEHVLETAGERIARFDELRNRLRHELPIDRAFLAPKALEGLPGRETLARADAVLDGLERGLSKVVADLDAVIAGAKEALGAVREVWGQRKREVLEGYEKILRELQRSKVDGEEFIRLRQRLEELRPLKERNDTMQRELQEHEVRRRNLLVEWEDLKSAEFRELKGAAERVSRGLSGMVRVNVTFAGNREPLLALLRDALPGRLSEAIEALRKQPDLSLAGFVDAVRTGRGILTQKFSLPAAQAERIAQAPASVLMQLEELDLAPTTGIELNVAPEGNPPEWQALENLSTGQKATAVLLLLLLESDAPLVVDQPEEDLDNRFITEGVIPKLREEKRRRQFVFATHNANVAVLGDAELILGLTARGEAGQGRGHLAREHMGSIDARPVREFVEATLEGGKTAFETRRLKYGY